MTDPDQTLQNKASKLTVFLQNFLSKCEQKWTGQIDKSVTFYLA